MMVSIKWLSVSLAYDIRSLSLPVEVERRGHEGFILLEVAQNFGGETMGAGGRLPLSAKLQKNKQHTARSTLYEKDGIRQCLH